MNACKRTIVILSLLLLIPMASAQSLGQPPGFSSQFGQSRFGDSRDQVRTSAKAAYDKVPQGGDLPVAIIFDMNPGWHIWTQKGGTPAGVDVFATAINTEVVIEIPDDGSLIAHEGFMQWPEPHVAIIAGGENPLAAFEGRSIAYLPVTIPPDAPLGLATASSTMRPWVSAFTSTLRVASVRPRRTTSRVCGSADCRRTRTVGTVSAKDRSAGGLRPVLGPPPPPT